MPQQQTSATQQFIEIESIQNEIVKLKNGGLRKILLVSGINFELKSEEEQGMIIYTFQGFLNSLDFSMQFFIHSRKLNIDGYLQKLEERENQETNDLLKNQIVEYREFIKSFVSQNAIMEKNFFLAVPYDPVQIPTGGLAITEKIKGLFGGSKNIVEQTGKTPEEKMGQLNQRVDQVLGGLNQIGLRAVILNDAELTELFYNLYNPESIEKRGLNLAKETNK